MNQAPKHVNFYRKALRRCRRTNLELDAALSLVMTDPARPAACLTRVFDSGDPDTTYGRLQIEGELEGGKLEVVVAVSDSLETPEGSLDELLGDPSLTFGEQVRLLRSLRHLRAVNTRDLLLHHLTGRYLWIFVGITPGGVCRCRIEGIRLDFPHESFTRYFPEIYQDSDFFDRYIAVFQSMFLDLERQADQIPRLLDYQNVSDEQLLELASWLGIDSMDGIFSPDQIRRIIAGIDLFQAGKGTRRTLAAVVELACGIRPRIVEQFQFDRLPAPESRRRLNAQLYGSGPNQFCVILDLTGNGGSLPLSQPELDRLIDEYSVIGSSHKLVLLRDCTHTDTHCYLDVNSRLSIPENASVDGAVLGGYLTVG
ncbi:hypothetical protein CE91St46_16870 [Eubacteriales bacterium]|nr:phage tail protein [Faecalicatena sp. BF-R-105]GKH50576.1 hypothetical protein CE91St46_16870 [Eubacteriales bacterium]GKH63298.1 hypothetical protein CE91St47_17670 [Eubacteriales bacterium]